MRRGYFVIVAAVFAVATLGGIDAAYACHHDGAAEKAACGDCGKAGCKGGECAKGGDCACKGGGECAKDGECACKKGGECAKADCPCKAGGECKCGEKGGDCGCGGHGDKAAAAAPKAFDALPAVGTKATCPVMGDEFTVSDKTQFSQYDGKFYVFCCPGCKPKFEAEPAKFAVK